MTVIATDAQRVSNVVKHEYDPSTAYCREVVSVAVVSGMKVGAVLDNATNAALVTVANTANASYVLIDPSVNVKQATPGNYNLLVLARGPAIVADAALSYAADVDTQPEKDAVNAVLKAKGILVSPQL
jgi:hypothetical protein